MRPLKIAIATGGRFHVLDLARELDALGHDVRFYSHVPKKRALQFGLPARCHVSILPFVFPLVGWERLLPGLLPGLHERILGPALSRAVILRLEPCDVFICMSGWFLKAAKYAKQHFGAHIFVERGSQHIVAQKEILAAVDAPGPSEVAIHRDLAGYELADRIVVPSEPVVESFVSRNATLAPKLFMNPYGVDLDQFPQRTSIPPGPTTALFAGSWSLRKGVDVLTTAIEQLPDVRLVHVGELSDLPFPEHPRFIHHDAVPQWRLKEFYANAHVHVLASREEGLALVQAQALASGLPLVCTDRTGGSNLAHSPALFARIRVVPSDNAEALEDALSASLSEAVDPARLSPLPEADRELLSWRAYGQRYSLFLEREFSRELAVAR